MNSRTTFALTIWLALICVTQAFAERKPDKPADAKLVVWGEVEEVTQAETDEFLRYKVKIRVENKERGRLQSSPKAVTATCFQRKPDAPNLPGPSGHTAVPKKGQFIRALLLAPKNNLYEGIYPDWFHEMNLNEDQIAAMRWVGSVGPLSHLECDDSLPGRPVTKLYTFKMWDSGVRDEHMKHAAAFPELRSLELLYSRVSREGLELVAEKLPKLENISLSGFNNRIGDEDIRPLMACKNLRRVNLMNTNVSDESMPALAAISSLQSLILVGTNITDAGLAAFSKHENLERISTSAAGTTNEGVKHLAEIKSLKVLDLESSGIEDSSLRLLANLNLTWLDVRTCKKLTEAGLLQLGAHKSLTHLNLHGTAATDAVMKELQGLKDLRRLTIQDTKVTDAGLMHLVDCKNLASISLNGTKVTKAGIAKFKELRPKCKVSEMWIE